MVNFVVLLNGRTQCFVRSAVVDRHKNVTIKICMR